LLLTPTASASGTHIWSQRFIAVLLVLVRQMRTRERSGSLDDTLSQRELPHSRHTGKLHSDTHCCTCGCRAFRASLFFFSTTIEDVSQSQI
jgi:hypothetical protein